MRIEQAAYTSRWQSVAPSAKAVLALAGMLAAWLSRQPASLLALAVVLMLSTLLLARVSVRTYFAALLPPLGFVAVSCLTMLVSLDGAGWHWTFTLLPVVETTALRSLAMLAATLGLVLTTPLPDLLGLLRRLGVPHLMLDLMVLCYRMLFVLRQAWSEGMAAQNARLGYHCTAQAWRSASLLAGQMAVQVWRRASALDMAAQARGYEGRLNILPTVFPQARRHTAWALLAGLVLIAATCAGERW
jgi:cobalt/nickel transport system permease protein